MSSSMADCASPLVKQPFRFEVLELLPRSLLEVESLSLCKVLALESMRLCCIISLSLILVKVSESSGSECSDDIAVLTIVDAMMKKLTTGRFAKI